jgi:hypothetical protein
MKKHLLSTAAAVVLLAGGTFFALQFANCGKQQQELERSEANVAPSRLSDSYAGIEYEMQWNQASRKLLFDGMAIHHETEQEKAAREGLNRMSWRPRFAREMMLVPPPKHPDEYSFDAGTIGDLGRSSQAGRYDGQLHYHIEWDDAKNRCVFKELEAPRTEENSQLFVEGGNASFGSICDSFNSRLDLLDSYLLY